MRVRPQLGLWISLGASSLLLVTLAAKAFVPKPVKQHAAASRSVQGPSSDRIRFSDGDQQQLRLGDGSTRVVRSLLQVPNRMQFGEFVWNDAGVPPGRIWLRIDLSRQILSVFRGEDEIATSVILYGQDETPTPIGNFPIRGMERNHRSNAYDAMMPFTLWLTSDGVAIHGSNVRQGLATHGCIGVPEAFAQRLFGVVKRGDLVSVVR
ncbi:L,D-transpeptidase [Sphingomonas pituitosa]|uniref:L,D-transpeptidase n=1 Tax=Sphingomonas pituitosa TaxID=99597 RepID=UPI00082A6E63|nr:L,D-transpeptidase [Sphingomonas pituitosa]